MTHVIQNKSPSNVCTDMKINNIPIDMAHEEQEPGNTKRAPRFRSYCFTLNNYSKDDIEYLIDTFDNEEGCRYVFQEETGMNGTPHLQGIFNFKHPKVFEYAKNLHTKMHIEKCRNLKCSINYCSKGETRTGLIYHKGFNINTRQVEVIKTSELYNWQINLKNELYQEPNKRKIIWYCDEIGNSGKSEFTKYIYYNFNHVFIFENGKKNDITFRLLKSKETPNICILDLSRSNEGFISYDCIESLKNGRLISGKYEGGFKYIPTPHVIVFANFEPNEEKLSKDRWDIRYLGERRMEVEFED